MNNDRQTFLCVLLRTWALNGGHYYYNGFNAMLNGRKYRDERRNKQEEREGEKEKRKTTWTSANIPGTNPEA